MAAVKTWFHRVETRALVWLAKGRTSSWVMASTLVAVSVGTAALSSQPGAAQPRAGSSTLPLAAYGCLHDPDGDGHIFCDGSVGMARLPASYGQCVLAQFGPVPILCRGTGRQPLSDADDMPAASPPGATWVVLGD
jgi:hypothetical protein